MISVFSPFVNGLLKPKNVVLTEKLKAGEVYDQLRNIYNQGAKVIEDSTILVVPSNEDEDRSAIIYAICTNADLRETVRWINRRITLCIGKETYVTLEIRRRIAMNMLYKLVQEGKADADIVCKMHSYLYENLQNEISLVLDDDLPF